MGILISYEIMRRRKIKGKEIVKKKIIFSIVGARPHFVKAAPFLEEMEYSTYQVFTIHTGQHYDKNMSDIFFKELNLPKPDINLGIGSGTHAFQTSAVMQKVEELIFEYKPEAVVVYGDTNTTLGGALASSKLYVPTIHIEAGVRCFNQKYPEEINRKIIDHVSNFLICPSKIAVDNLKKEGLTNGVEFIGDFMYDSFLKAQKISDLCKFDLKKYGVKQDEFILSTMHREKTTNSPKILNEILCSIGNLPITTLLPMHPRTMASLQNSGYSIKNFKNLKIINPVSYLEMMSLLKNCKLVMTDSGGLEKEAYWQGKPCITLMEETTWIETIDAGWNVLVGLNIIKIEKAISNFVKKDLEEIGARPAYYGSAGAAKRFVKYMGWT